MNNIFTILCVCCLFGGGGGGVLEDISSSNWDFTIDWLLIAKYFAEL